MIVANRTSRRQTEPGLSSGTRSINGVAKDELFLNTAAFTRRHIATIESGGNHLILRRVLP